MATGTKICKICGKEYECCKTVRHVDGVFRWQDVACCVEHGQEYLNLVLMARSDTHSASTESNMDIAENSEAIPQKKKTRRKKKTEE